jgi:protein-S-isoprenylcysteine O-methyltransferase Ste14
MELTFDIFVTFAGAGFIGLAAWSGRGHFSSDKVPLGSIVIAIVVLITTLLYLYLLWAQAQPLLAQLLGFLLMVGGLGLFFMAIRASREGRLRMAFDEGNPRGLVQHGPYGYVRHPFYVSYIIFFSGFALATWSPIAIAPLVILVVIYVSAARMEERLFADTPMASSYEAYRQRTGFFFPKLSNGFAKLSNGA